MKLGRGKDMKSGQWKESGDRREVGKGCGNGKPEIYDIRDDVQ